MSITFFQGGKHFLGGWRLPWLRACSWILHGNRFALANLTTSSKLETRKLHTIISQLHHITTAKHFTATF